MLIQDKYQELFSNEIKALNHAKDCLEIFGEHPLHPQYLFLLENYEKLLKLTKKICMISDIQGEALKKKEAEIETLLREANQGLKQVEYWSFHDALTTLYNRAFIDQAAAELIQGHLPVSVIFIDVNGLKLMNDVFGHQKGDELLKKVANIIIGSLGKSDIAARWGGDEFLIIMPGTTAENCQKIVEWIKLKCKLEEKDPIEVSVAIGTATSNRKDEDIYDLLTIAEKRMYKNKMLSSKQVRQAIIDNLEIIVRTEDAKSGGHIHHLRFFAERLAEMLRIENFFELNDLQLLITLYNIEQFISPKENSKTVGELADNKLDTSETNNEVGYRLARAIGETAIADAILGFYEYWDGTGYPNHLKGEQIPILSRVLAIIHNFYVMVYHANLPVEEALSEIKKQSGKQFDPVLAQLFLDHITTIMNSR